MNKKLKIIITILIMTNLVLGSFIVYLLNRPEKIDLGKYLSKEQVMTICEKYSSNISILRKLFPEYAIYLDQKELKIEELNPNIKKHTFNWDYLKYEEGLYTYNDPDIATFLGVDISHHSEIVEWDKVKEQGISFAMLRLGYRGSSVGKINKDSYFDRNYEECIKYGIKVGVYFFSQAVNKEEVIEEADFVIEELKNHDIKYPVVFDIELGNGERRTDSLTNQDIIDLTKTFLDKIKEAGYIPAVYGNSHYFFCKADEYIFNNYEIWYAQYPLGDSPYLPYHFEMWQFTDSGKIEGIKNPCDINISFKDYN